MELEQGIMSWPSFSSQGIMLQQPRRIPLIHNINKLFDERVYPSRNKERSLHYSTLNSNPSYHIVLSRKREIFMIIVVFHHDDFAHREE